MNVTYKILCEVKLMHEYYLTESKGETVFDLATQALRLDFLQKQFQKNVPDIGNDLQFVFPDMLKTLYKGYHLKILPTYAGFKIAVGCNKKILADASIVFEPKVLLPPQLEIIVAVAQKKPINKFSQQNLKKQFQSVAYYENDSITAPKTFPFLVAPVAAKDNAIPYEQGDIANIGAGVIAQFLNNGAINPWKALVGNGYTSQADLLIVPLQFTYHFTAAEQMKSVVITLRDGNGNEIKTITQSAAAPFLSVYINLIGTAAFNSTLKTIPITEVTIESIYTLEVAGSNGYNKVFRLLLADTLLPIAQYAGLINIKPFVTNAAFQLQQADGHLPLLDGAGNPRVPVFEIWLKSKLLFLQYRHNRQKKLKLSTETTGLLTNNSGVLVTENPVGITYQPVTYQKQDASFQIMPNPNLEDTIQVNSNKTMVQMLVPDSKIFPLQ